MQYENYLEKFALHLENMFDILANPQIFTRLDITNTSGFHGFTSKIIQPV